MLVSTLTSKVVQIQTASIPATVNNGDYVELIALCEDGSIWMSHRSNGSANVPNGNEWFCLLEGMS